MAYGTVTERDVVTVGDHGLIALIHCKRHKIVSLTIESSGNGTGDRGNHSLHIHGGKVHLSGNRVADSVGRL